MQNLRIAVAGPYPPPFGGVSTTVLQLTERMTKENYSLCVFASNQPSDDVDDYVTHFSLRAINPARNLMFQVKKFSPNVVCSHQSGIDWKLGAIAMALRTPIVHHVYGERFAEQFSRMPSKSRQLIEYFSRASNAIVAASSELADFLHCLGVNRHVIHVIPCLLPLETNLSPADDLITTDERELAIVTTGFYPLTNQHYGFHLVPNAARRLRENGIAFTWYLVGQASKMELENFERLLTENGVHGSVVFVGELDRPEMLGLLEGAHIYVRTKYSDSFGIVIAEAHQLGCHCLFGDNNPYFQEGPRLTKYRTGDPDSLTEKLLKITSQISLDKPRPVDSPFAAEAKANYEDIKRIYEDIATRT